jgi:hypothetical protein
MVADGFPNVEVSKWELQHIILPDAHNDVGNTPRSIGSISAMNQGFEAIAYLDADNWFYPNHIDSMVKLQQQSGAAVCTATRTIHRQDGSALYLDAECDGKQFVDTSCYFFTQQAFRLLPMWAMMPRELSVIGDRVIWELVKGMSLACAHNRAPTVAYRTQYQGHYRCAGETPPDGMKSNEAAEQASQWLSSQPAEMRADWERKMGIRK